MTPSSRVAALGVHLPERTRSTVETERELRARNPKLKLATGPTLERAG